MTLASAFEFASLAIAVLLLALGLGVIVKLLRTGGFELTFAHLVASADRRSLFLKALYASLASLFALGFSTSLELLLGAPDVVVAATGTALFGVGAIGIIVLMRDAFRADPLTLMESWNLRESAERSLLEFTRPPTAPDRSAARSDGGRNRRPSADR